MEKHYFTFLSFFLCLSPFLSAQVSPDIRLSQTGFYPDGEKLAAVINPEAGTFTIRSSTDDSEVLSDALSKPKSWDKSGEKVALADFSSITIPGVYYLEVEGLGRSFDFFIGNRSHLGTARSALKAYYFNRASTPILAEFGHQWERPEGHPDTEVRVHPSAATPERPAGTVISAPKGWYDAGDYNKYIVNSGISTYTLLSAYQHFPQFFNELETNIPESGNNVPDILDEVRWNLEWMLDMQDPYDGGVYHKLSTANFSGAVMPLQANATRYVVQKSTAAALNFAAVMAQANRVFQEIDPDFASTALAAAKEAYEWALENPAVYYRQGQMNSQFDPDINTGEYGDDNVSDEFNWAATELYLSTQDDPYFDRINLNFSGWFGPPGWNSVNTLALMSLFFYEDELVEAGKGISDEVRNAFISAADAFLNAKKEAPYGVTLNEFYWGSNSVAANQGIILIAAYHASGNAEYLEAANASLDYLLGRNATTYSFVSGIGKKPPMNIHHRQSEADAVEEPVPGFLAGGPNPGQQDNCTYPSTLPAKSYVDSWCSYASNEVTINWNAPLVFLAAGLESAYEQNHFASLNTVPAAPEDLKAEPMENSGVELEWSALSSDVIRYVIERSEGNEETFEIIAEPIGTILSYSDTENDLKSNTTYFYRIKSVNTFGESAYSEVVSAEIEDKNPTGLFERQAFNKQLKVYPNPSSGELRILVHPQDVGTPLKLKIRNLHGQVLGDYSFESTDKVIFLEIDQLKGYFILQLEGKDTLYAPQKVILQ